MFNSNQAFLLVQKLKLTNPNNGFTLGVEAEIFKIFQSAPEWLINAELYGLVFGPKADEKRIPSNLGSQFATLEANVPAFINILTSMF